MSLLDHVIAMPVAHPRWPADIRQSYTDYIESQAARVLRHEDRLDVMLLFSMQAIRLTYLRKISGDPASDLKVLQAIRILDSMIDRKSNNLGIGPLARTRLGIARAEKISKDADAVRLAQAKATDNEEF